MTLLDGRDETLAKVLETCKMYEPANVNKSILESKAAVVTSIAEVDSIKRVCFNCEYSWSS